MKPSQEHIRPTLALFRVMPGLREPETNTLYEEVIEGFLDGKSVEELRAAGKTETVVGAVVLLRGDKTDPVNWRYRALSGAPTVVRIVHVLWWLASHPRPLSKGAIKKLDDYVAPLTWDLSAPFGLWLLERCAEAAEMTVEELVES